MPRNRIIYNTLGIFVSQTSGVLMDQNRNDRLLEGPFGETLPYDIEQLKGIQSFDFNINRNYEILEELGSLSSIQIENENPTITANISYYLQELAKNEQYIGLNTMDSSLVVPLRPLIPCLSGIISENIEKNYYILVSTEGIDLNSSPNNFDVIGLGNVCLTSYELNAGVGAIPTIDIGLEALNIKLYKDPSKIWGVNYKINDIFSNNLYNGKVKIVNYNNTNDLMIISQPNDPLPSDFSGPSLYIENNNIWTRNTNGLTGLSLFTDNINSARYGASVDASNSGKYIIIGGPNSDNLTGSALLYERSGSNWNLIRKLSGVNNSASGPIFAPPGSRYGTNVGINKSGDVTIMVSPYDEFGYGGALIYTGNFNSPAYKITGSNSVNMGLGADINGDGNVIILGGGSPFYFDGLTDIFTGNKNIGWKLAQSITGENGGQHGRICSINDNGNVIVLAGPNNNSILIYTGNATTKWGFAQKISGYQNHYGFNLSINSDASTIAFGQIVQDPYINSIGVVSIYTGNPQSKWALNQIISGNNDGDFFGEDVSINYDGNTIAVNTAGEIPQYPYNSYLGVVNILNKTNIKGLPSIDPENIIDTNNLLFKIPNIQTATGLAVYNPGDIKFQMSGLFGFNMLDLKIQDFSLSIDLNRNPLKKLGKQYPFVREFNFPIKAQLEVNCLVGDLESGNLYELICGKPFYDFDIKFTDDFCKSRGLNTTLYMFKKARLVSQNFTSDLGNNSTMNAVYEIDLSNPSSIDQGIFIDFRA